MGPSMLERLKALGPARVQKIALRLDHDETPSCMLTLYNGDKLHVGFLGSESYCENTPCEQVSWGEAKPSKSQAAFRHHLLNTELTQAQINQGTFVFNFKHKDEKPRQLIIEPGKKSYCVLLLQVKDSVARLIAFHGSSEDKNKRRKVGQVYNQPHEPFKSFTNRATSQPKASPTNPLLLRLKAETKRLKRLQKNIQKDIAKLGDPEKLYTQGHLLTAHLGTVSKGQKEALLQTAQGQQVQINLRPDKTPAQNMELIFSKAKKAQRGLEKIKPRLLAIEVRLRILSEMMSQHNLSVEEVNQILSQKALAPSARRKAALAGRAKPWRCFQVTDTAYVWVGKNARGNDELTFHHAKGKDIWLHIRDAAGAHVIVPERFSQEPQVMLAAAQLAAHFSPLRHEGKVQIRRTARKNVRKPGKGAAPGKVLVASEENSVIETDSVWVAALLQQEKPA